MRGTGKIYPIEALQDTNTFSIETRQGQTWQAIWEILGGLELVVYEHPIHRTGTWNASYAKLLKDILSNKRRLEEYETMALIEECSFLI